MDGQNMRLGSRAFWTRRRTVTVKVHKNRAVRITRKRKASGLKRQNLSKKQECSSVKEDHLATKSENKAPQKEALVTQTEELKGEIKEEKETRRRRVMRVVLAFVSHDAVTCTSLNHNVHFDVLFLRHILRK